MSTALTDLAIGTSPLWGGTAALLVGWRLSGAERYVRAEQRKARAEERLAQLGRNIKALENWNHAWRLEHDEDYRELHPGEWCSRHHGPSTDCAWRSCYPRRRHSFAVEPYEIRTFDGRVIRSRPAQREAPELTLEARRAATRTMAEWGRGGDAV